VVKTSEQIPRTCGKLLSRQSRREQRDGILERLTAQKRRRVPGRSRRYTEFIDAAANHMQVLSPFIPALEMLRKALG
jgi:hypothetical protein